jgi:biuret amidohydrolase
VGLAGGLIVSDATESYFPEFKRVTLQMLTAQGAIVAIPAPMQHALQIG